MKMQSLQDLLLEELKDLYSAESQLLKALPKMARAATNPDLKAGFEEHLEQTRGQKERLEQIFEGLGHKPRSKTCEGMKGVIEEGESHMKLDAEDATMDAVLIAAAQKAEHYEIAAYGTARAWAETLGLQDAAALLQQTLDEEKQTDEKLTELATTIVNAMSAAGEDEGEEEDGDLEESAEEHEEIEGMMEDAFARGEKRAPKAPPSTQRRGGGRQRSRS